MTVTLLRGPHLGHSSRAEQPRQLVFDAGILTERLNKDEAFQKRVKVISIIVAALLLVGGGTGIGLAVTIVPYCLLHTVLLGVSTGASTFGFMGATGIAAGIADQLFNRNPLRSKIKEQIIEFSNDTVTISSETSWEYLLDFHKTWQKKAKKHIKETLEIAHDDHTFRQKQIPLLLQIDVRETPSLEIDPMYNLVQDYCAIDLTQD